jgi:hypothetical protein
MADRTQQRALPLRQPQTPSGARHVATARTPSGVVYEFHSWTDLGPALPFEQIPAWLRLPGEPGRIELDRYMRRVSEKGSAG